MSAPPATSVRYTGLMTSELASGNDRQTAPDLRQSAAYLAGIIAHFLEFGPLWEKTPADLVYELDYHNAWQQFAVEQERKRGEPAAEYYALRLVDLRALSAARTSACRMWRATARRSGLRTMSIN